MNDRYFSCLIPVRSRRRKSGSHPLHRRRDKVQRFLSRDFNEEEEEDDEKLSAKVFTHPDTLPIAAQVQDRSDRLQVSCLPFMFIATTVEAA